MINGRFHNPFEIESIHICLAFFLDLLIGDPRWMPHPVRLIGAMVHRIEKILRRIFTFLTTTLPSGTVVSLPVLERAGGIFLVLIVVAITFGVTSMISSYFLSRNSLLFFILFVFLASTVIATRGLITSVKDVLEAVKAQDIIGARKNLSHIVGRDTDKLSQEEVLKAATESLSENLSDGIIAPLFYLAIGGLPLVMTYKAINTMDSMIGYRDSRYRYLGWAAARLDDIANFIPARLTAVLIIISASILSIKAFKRTYSVTCAFRRSHLSPNSGYPESAMAGALGVQLGGPSTYRGIIVEKPYIGIYSRPVDIQALEEGLKIATISAFLGVLIATAGRAV